MKLVKYCVTTSKAKLQVFLCTTVCRSVTLFTPKYKDTNAMLPKLEKKTLGAVY